MRATTTTKRQKFRAAENFFLITGKKEGYVYPLNRLIPSIHTYVYMWSDVVGILL